MAGEPLDDLSELSSEVGPGPDPNRPRPEPRGCRFSREPYVPDGMAQHGADLCHNAIFVADVPPLPVHRLPYHAPGYFHLRSQHPIRATAPPNIPADQATCRYHWGYFGMDARGYLMAVHCSQHGVNPQTRRVHRMYARNNEQGYLEWVSSYHVPPWTELHFRSNKMLTGVEPF